MEFRVLGPLQILAADGSEVVLPSASQRRLMCLLIASAGTIVSADTLSLQLDLSPGALRTTVSRLRRLLNNDILVTTAPGYGLRTDQIDSITFEREVHLSHAMIDPHGAIAALRTALGLWRGAAYAEFAHEQWVLADSRRLAELRAGAVEDLAKNLLTLGQHHEAIAELETLIAEEPFRDRPRELLMRALAGSGRRVEALREFQDYRRLLVEEVGTEPSGHIVDLDRQIASESPSRTPGRHNLPSPLTSFIGRESEAASVKEFLKAHRLVTLTGAGGCGKSRLALHVVTGLRDAYPGGAWWVELSQVNASSNVAESVARTIELVALSSTEATEQLVQQLHDAGPNLIVLDNAEHVLDGAAGLADELLGRCPELHVLVTSREPLGLPGELVWRVPSLSTPRPDSTLEADQLLDFDAPALLIERVHRANPDVVLDDDTMPIIRSICERLDGLPLALELAAARTRTWRLDWILAGVDSTVEALQGDSRAALPRHRTLHASIAWSVNLLEEADRDALRRLSVFPAPANRAAAIAMTARGAQEPGATSASLEHLVNKSLVQFDDASGRYRMLATIRQFSHGLLVERGELDATMATFSRYFARWCTELGDGAHGIERTPVHDEMPNIVAAMDWARDHAPEDALQMVAGLAAMRSTLGHHANLAATWDWLLAFDRDGPHRVEWARAVAALMAAATSRAGLDTTDIVADVESRLADDDDQARGWLARGTAMVPAYRGDLDPVSDYAEALIDRGDDLEASVYIGFAAYMLAIAGRLADAGRCTDHLHQVTRRHRSTFSVDTVGNGYAAEVLVAATRGQLTEAAEHGTTAIPRDAAFSMTAACALAQSALMAQDRTLLERSLAWSSRGTLPLLEFYAIGIDLYRLLIDHDFEAAAHAAQQYWDDSVAVPLVRVHQRAILNVALIETGRISLAERCTEEAATLLEAMRSVPLLRAVVHQARAQVACAALRDETLGHEAQAMLELAENHGFTPMTVDALELLAVAAHRSGSDDDARRLLDAALTERGATGYRFVMVTPRGAYDELVATRLNSYPSL